MNSYNNISSTRESHSTHEPISTKDFLKGMALISLVVTLVAAFFGTAGYLSHAHLPNALSWMHDFQGMGSHGTYALFGVSIGALVSTIVAAAYVKKVKVENTEEIVNTVETPETFNSEESDRIVDEFVDLQRKLYEEETKAIIKHERGEPVTGEDFLSQESDEDGKAIVQQFLQEVEKAYGKKPMKEPRHTYRIKAKAGKAFALSFPSRIKEDNMKISISGNHVCIFAEDFVVNPENGEVTSEVLIYIYNLPESAENYSFCKGRDSTSTMLLIDPKEKAKPSSMPMEKESPSKEAQEIVNKDKKHPALKPYIAPVELKFEQRFKDGKENFNAFRAGNQFVGDVNLAKTDAKLEQKKSKNAKKTGNVASKPVHEIDTDSEKDPVVPTTKKVSGNLETPTKTEDNFNSSTFVENTCEQPPPPQALDDGTF